MYRGEQAGYSIAEIDSLTGKVIVDQWVPMFK